MNPLRPRSLRPAVAALLAAAGLALVPACRKQAPVELTPQVASSDEALFKLGEEAIKKDEEKGVLYLRQVIDAFPKSFYAQRAKLLIADAYFRKGDEGSMLLAASEYREFISLYPFSPSAAYAQYQIALSSYKKALKPGRDQTKTTQALADFRQVVARYPGSEQAKLAEQAIKECEQRLAEHEFLIGYTYYRQKAFKASTARLNDILTTYPAYTGLDKVYYYLADSYFQAGMNDKARPFFTKLLTDFPTSPLAKKAQDRMARLEATPAPAQEKKTP